ncbi:hypothetical protein Pla175_01410 [Pirellulimonas nuda]|uniref:Nuclease-related domain protein n=1 Tax=Pirellulimonas nuda TaxID=2528009 RepID=A0A518D5Q3_9BACT|nr:nuclease-related domain-containing protein [Pirellulimonas nuda]QDU86789.1 hypothetical protein Pla175_01410 [Pirellulimonas nuda]
MHLETKIQKAVARFDWPTVEAHLKAGAPSLMRARAEKFLDVILRDGYLIIRRPNDGQKAARDHFLESMGIFFSQETLIDLLHDRADKVSSMQHTEEAYQEVLQTLSNDVLSYLSPEQLAWAAIRHMDSEIRSMESQCKASLSTMTEMVDPVSIKLPIEADGPIVSPDDALNTLQTALTATLKMLGYNNSWFDDEGALVLPAPVSTTGGHKELAIGNILLATIWGQVERSDSRCRYFGGSVTRQEIETNHFAAPDDGPRKQDSVCFAFDDGGEIELHIAGERLRRKLFDIYLSVDRFHARAAEQPAAPSPPTYISTEETRCLLALTSLLFMPVDQDAKLFAGLTLREWTRGYAVIHKMARDYLEDTEPHDGLVMVAEADVVKTLTGHGLHEEKARTFLRHTTFGRGSVDVFDSPFVRCQDGRYCFVVTVAAFTDSASAIVSQLSSLRCDMSWKGKPFEEDTVKLLREQCDAAVGIHSKINGEELEIDCVALWDDILFVVENKNYFLPRDNPQSEYWFMKDQSDAARQVKAKAQSIEAHPQIVLEKLGKTVKWRKLVPVVLNGSPFSKSSPIEGVHFYDASALHRFFEQGFVSYSLVKGNSAAAVPVPESTIRLWSAPSPCAEDLLRQLENPAQVVHCLKLFKRNRLVAPMSQRLYLDTITLERLPSTVGNFGGEEQDLKNSIDEKESHGS